jgi:hypothetical protein
LTFCNKAYFTCSDLGSRHHLDAARLIDALAWDEGEQHPKQAGRSQVLEPVFARRSSSRGSCLHPHNGEARVSALPLTRRRAGPCHGVKSWGRSFRNHLQGSCLAGSLLFRLFQNISGICTLKSENCNLATIECVNRSARVRSESRMSRSHQTLIEPSASPPKRQPIPGTACNTALPWRYRGAVRQALPQTGAAGSDARRRLSSHSLAGKPTRRVRVSITTFSGMKLSWIFASRKSALNFLPGSP